MLVMAPAMKEKNIIPTSCRIIVMSFSAGEDIPKSPYPTVVRVCITKYTDRMYNSNISASSYPPASIQESPAVSSSYQFLEIKIQRQPTK